MLNKRPQIDFPIHSYSFPVLGKLVLTKQEWTLVSHPSPHSSIARNQIFLASFASKMLMELISNEIK